MSDVFREVDEALREDRAKQLWQRYGRYAVAVAIVVVAAVAGFNFWQSWQQSQREEQTAALTRALDASVSDPAAAADRLAALAAQGGGAGVMARLNEAALRAAAGDAAAAAELYDAVVADADATPEWRDYARLMAVLHRLDLGDPAALEQQLAPLMGDDNPWRHSARELTALVALRKGETQRALELLTALAADDTAPPGIRARAGELAASLEG